MSGFIKLGSQASLDRSPRANWIENIHGELPGYVREVARAIERSGHPLDQAIQIAIGRIKTWASGVGVSAAVQAKAAKALAEWEQLKLRAHAKQAVKATALNDNTIDSTDFISFSPLQDLLLQLAVSSSLAQRDESLERVLSYASKKVI